MVNQARGGGFAVGTCDADHFRLRVAARELDFADDGNAFCDGLRHDRSRVGNARTLDDFRGRENPLLRVLSFFPLDAALVEHLLIFVLDFRHIADEHVEALLLGQRSSSHATLGSSEDGDRPAPSPCRGLGGLIAIVIFIVVSHNRFVFSLPRGKGGHLIFKVMIANAAKMMVVIQKRTVIFDSWNCRCGHLVKT